MAVRALQDGTIGKIKEVHSWCPKSWGDDPRPAGAKSDPVPAGFDWNLWLGVCAERPFIGDEYYHPGTWRKRLDFGTGTLGDMGCHIFDPVFESIGLAAPASVRSEGVAPNQWNWARNGKVTYTFDATPRTSTESMSLTWYDGDAKLPTEIIALVDGKEVPDQGSIFIGTDGVMLLPHAGVARMFPAVKLRTTNSRTCKDITTGANSPSPAGATVRHTLISPTRARSETILF